MSIRTYDVYRHERLAARMRVLENGDVEWAYRPGPCDWQGFWWSNDVKVLIEELIHDFPHWEKLTVSEFTIQQYGPDLC